MDRLLENKLYHRFLREHLPYLRRRMADYENYCEMFEQNAVGETV